MILTKVFVGRTVGVKDEDQILLTVFMLVEKRIGFIIISLLLNLGDFLREKVDEKDDNNSYEYGEIWMLSF